LDGRALVRGIAVGLVVIVPVSVVVEVLERNVDDLDGSPWLFIPFVAIIAAYVLAGRWAAMAAPDAPLRHAALAALGAFAGWMVVRVLVPVVQGNDLDIGARAVVFNAMFAVAFGVLGGALRSSHARA
ncbi:MAG: hypothetical protein ABWX92_05760, partial [Mycetocola sp.]